MTAAALQLNTSGVSNWLLTLPGYLRGGVIICHEGLPLQCKGVTEQTNARKYHLESALHLGRSANLRTCSFNTRNDKINNTREYLLESTLLLNWPTTFTKPPCKGCAHWFTTSPELADYLASAQPCNATRTQITSVLVLLHGAKCSQGGTL